jgi:hypothetical protein
MTIRYRADPLAPAEPTGTKAERYEGCRYHPQIALSVCSVFGPVQRLPCAEGGGRISGHAASVIENCDRTPLPKLFASCLSM